MTQTFETANPFASASLYVGDLNPDVTEATLFELFNTVGPVASVRVCRDFATRGSLGYAYVNFHSTKAAEQALETMNYANIKGRQCRIMWSQRDKQLRESGKSNIFVKNLPESLDNKILHDTFITFGPILSCKIMVDPDTGKSRGYGYVHYLNQDDAKKAVEGVNKMLVANKPVFAEFFIPREERIQKTPWTNVYVKHIPLKMTEEGLKKLFEEKTGGKITSSYMFEKPMFGKSACLNFDTHESAAKSVELLNNYEMKEFADEKENDKSIKLYVARCQKRSERNLLLKTKARNNRGRPIIAPTENNLYVKPLSLNINDDKLREIFSSYGTIISAKIMRNPETGQSRGFGFVCFKHKEEASQALTKLNGATIEGTKLYVAKAQKKADRQQYLANRPRRQSPRRHPNSVMDQTPFYPVPPQMGGYYSYPRPGMPPQPPMHPAQFPHPQMARPHPFNSMAPVPQIPLQMQMQPMGMQMPQFGFPHMRMPNPAFSGMQQNVAMQPQPQPSNSAAVAGGASGSAAMRGGLMNSVGAASQGAVGGRGAGPQGAASQGMSSATGAPVTYSQPTQAVAAVPVQHSIFASAGQTGVEPSVQSRPVHSFPSQMSATEREAQPLTPQMLNNATAQERKRMIGERLFPKIQEVEPRLAGKITGMLLEMENTELLVLLNNKDQLRKKINEALSVLKEHHKKQSLRNSESQARQRAGSQGNQSASNRQTSASNN